MKCTGIDTVQILLWRTEFLTRYFLILAGDSAVIIPKQILRLRGYVAHFHKSKTPLIFQRFNLNSYA